MSILMQENLSEPAQESPRSPANSRAARSFAARSFSVLTTPSSQFVDFYSLLNEPENASASRLRARMAELYAEAQGNRDHRNPTTRRRYNDLLEMLPKCRAILLDDARRKQYDDYIMQSRVGTPDVEFLTFLNRLTASPKPRSGEYDLEYDDNAETSQDDFSEVLGVRAAGSAASDSTASDSKTNDGAASNGEVAANASQSVSHHSRELQRDAVLHLALMLRLASACGAGVFFLTLAVTRSGMRESLAVSLGVAGVLGLASWFGARQHLLRRKVRDEVAVAVS